VNVRKLIASPPPLKAWDEFRFGMSFDEAITAAAGIEWDGDSFRKCRDQIPVKGCTLSPDAERSYRSSIAGMTAYGIDEFWRLAMQVGFVPELVELCPRNELDVRYAYFTLRKPD